MVWVHRPSRRHRRVVHAGLRGRLAGDNPGFPTAWFARSQQYGCVCPAPFFAAELAVPPAAAVTFRYALVVADGDHDHGSVTGLADDGRRVLTGWSELGRRGRTDSLTIG